MAHAFDAFVVEVDMSYFHIGWQCVGFDREADKQNYFVTDTGITVVTRDYSLFESPVPVDYFTSE